MTRWIFWLIGYVFTSRELADGVAELFENDPDRAWDMAKRAWFEAYTPCPSEIYLGILYLDHEYREKSRDPWWRKEVRDGYRQWWE